MGRHRMHLALLLALLALLLLLGIAAPVTADNGGIYYWDYYNVDLTILPNGKLEVAETMRYEFTAGLFTYASREIPTGRVEGIADVWVEENGERYGSERVSISNDGKNVNIKWAFPPTYYGARTFVLHYTVLGGIRIYDDGDQVWWRAICSGREQPVRSATVAVHLPAALQPEDLRVAAYGTGARFGCADPRTVLFEAGEIAPGRELEVRVQFPHGLVTAAPPAWQAEADRQAAEDARTRSTMTLLLAVVGALVVVGGGLVILLLLYRRWQEAKATPGLAYLAELPSDLRPGLARILVYGKADLRAVVAAIVDLARRDVIVLQEQYQGGVFAPGARRDFTVRLLQPNLPMEPFEQDLLERLLLGRREQRLSMLGRKLHDAIVEVQDRMSTEVAARGLFPEGPEQTRQRYILPGQALLVLSGGLGLVASGVLQLFPTRAVRVIAAFLYVALGTHRLAALFLAGALAAIGVLLILIGSLMPRRTPAGVEEAARWRAFRRYLAEIEKYGDLGEAADIFDRYLPYAIAFDLDREWVHKFAVASAPAPRWFVPYITMGSAGLLAGTAIRDAPDLSGLARSVPSLGAMSASLAATIQGLSEDLAATINAAAKAPTARELYETAKTPGGWSGGGDAGGGGSGGGRAGAG